MAKKIFLIMLVVFFALLVVKDFLIKSAITSIGSNIIGVPIKIRKFSLGILSRTVCIVDMKLYNPPGFPNEFLIELPIDLLKLNVERVF